MLGLNNSIPQGLAGFNGFNEWESLNNAVQDNVTYRPLTGIAGVLNGITSAWSRSAVSVQRVQGPATFTNAYEPAGIPIPYDFNVAYGLNNEGVVTFPATNYTRMAHCIVYNSGVTKTIQVYEAGLGVVSTFPSPGTSGYWYATRIVDTGTAIRYYYYNLATGLWVLQHTSVNYVPPVGGWKADVALERASQTGTMMWQSGVLI